MMRMTHGDSERVGGVIRLWIGFRQQHADHHANLRLFAVACADNRLLHQVRRIFRDRQPAARGHEHGNAARLAKFERRGGIGVDESLLHRGFMRTISSDHPGKFIVDRYQSAAEILAVAGGERSTSNVNEPIAVRVDQAPAGASEARIDTEDANRLPVHVPVDSPAAGPTQSHA